MKKFGRVIVASVLVSSMFASSVNTTFAAPSVDELQSNKEAAQGEVSSLQTQLTKIVKKINKLESNLSKKGAEIDKANKDLTVAEAKEKEQYSAMKLRIKYMYEESGDGVLEKLLESRSIAELLNQAQYVQEVHSYDRNMLNSYVATKNKIATLKTSLEKDMTKMKALKKDYASEQKTLSTTLEEKKDEVADLDAELQAAAIAAAEAAAKEQEQQAARAAANNAGNSSGTNNNTVNNNNNNSNNDDNDGQASSNKKPESNSNSSSGNGNSNSSGGSSATGSAIVSAAYSYIGVPYKWGGASRKGVDCSGLVMLSYASVGISVAHSSTALGGSRRVSSPRPGDVCCGPGHVGIYIGGGKMIHAPTEGQKVKVASVQGGMWYTRWY